MIDQYRVKTDRRSGIVNDPNRAEDPQYIERLIGKMIGVSLETVEIVAGLSTLGRLGRRKERSRRDTGKISCLPKPDSRSVYLP